MGVHVASQSTVIKIRTNILISSFIFILLIVECESSSSKNENRERDALLMFKMSLKNAEAVLRNWNDPPRLPCPRLGSSRTNPPWRGVICLNGNNNYSGNIDDDAFLGMSSLKRLDIADNRFSGEVPTSLASSMRLLELRIENNRFVGTIPEFPPTLVKFNASNNQLQGRIPPSLCDITDTSSFSAYYYRPQEKLLVFNFVHNGSLSKQLHRDRTSEKKAGGLNWPTRLAIIKGVAKGMVYLYKKLPNLLVAHGNLKSSNVLLDKWMQPLLMDYTLLPVVNVEQAHNLMAAFKAPAFCKQGRIDKSLDVWSLGILILETMTGKLPSTHIERWVETIEKEKVFDKELGGTENAQAQMTMLLAIGLKCCKVDEVEKIPELIEVANKIQQLDEKDI
nr:pollen receptor-like kinase 4 [Tanacetum cinerariifolium]